jgi:type I restriction enzyme M protein
MLDQETKKRIDDCRNILVGKVPDPKSQVEQITIAMIYKFMHDMDLESMEMGGISTFFTGEYEKYSWGNIFNPRIGGNEMIALYGEGIVKMNLNPNIPQLFRDIFKNAYLPYRDPETLKLFLKGINQFQYSHSEKLGDSFEYLLSILGSQGDAGQFRTPRHIIDFVVELIQPKKNEKVLDPACGTSGFLISSYKHILRNNTKTNTGDLITPDERNKLVENFSGYDISPDMVRLSLVNLYLHNFSNPKIYEYDSLTSEDRWNEYYDVILANPPFMSPKGGIKPHKRFSIQSNRAEVLFIDYIMEHLTPKGRSGIIVPEGIIFQSGIAYKSLRKSLVEKYLVGVISLPSGIFQPYSGVKTSILILDKELSPKTDKIFFGKVDSDGFDLGSQRRENEKNDLPILTKEVTEYLEGLRIEKVVVSEKLTYVLKEQILGSSDVGLSYDRYTKSKVKDNVYQYVKLQSLCDLQNGYAFKSTEYITHSNTLNFRMSNIRPNGILDLFHNEKYLPDDFVIKYKDYILNDGDVVIAMTDMATEAKILGVPTIIKTDGRNLLLNQRVGRFKDIDSSKIHIPFLKWILSSNSVKEYYKSLGGGGLQINIGKNEILSIEIPLPPIETQEEIVSELEYYQKILDGAKQVVDNYKHFIDIDPSWDLKELCEVSLVTSGYSFKSGDFSPNGEIKSIKITNVGVNQFIDDENEYLPKSFLQNHKNFLVYQGDIVLALTRPVISDGLKITIVPENYNESLLNQRVASIRCKNEIVSNQFMYYLLNDKTFVEYVEEKSKSLMQPNLSINDLKKYRIPIPSIEIQTSIIEKIETENQIIEGNKQLIEIYTQKIQNRINKIWGL